MRTPVWGVWLDGALYFGGSPETRRGRNIAANPAVVVNLESGQDVEIIERDAHEASHPEWALANWISADYKAKYGSDGYELKPDQWDAGGLYRMRLRVVFGLDRVASQRREPLAVRGCLMSARSLRMIPCLDPGGLISVIPGQMR